MKWRHLIAQIPLTLILCRIRQRRLVQLGSPPRGEGRKQNMCFCETNPPFFRGFFDATFNVRGTCGGNVRRNSVGSFSKTKPPEMGFERLEAGNVTNEPNYSSADVQREWCGQVKCAVGRPAHNVGTRGHPGPNSLEVTLGSAYAPGSSLRRF